MSRLFTLAITQFVKCKFKNDNLFCDTHTLIMLPTDHHRFCNISLLYIMYYSEFASFDLKSRQAYVMSSNYARVTRAVYFCEIAMPYKMLFESKTLNMLIKYKYVTSNANISFTVHFKYKYVASHIYHWCQTHQWCGQWLYDCWPCPAGQCDDLCL